MNRVLVTGGAGYIGSHTVRELTNAGFEPVVLDNLSTGHRSAVGRAGLIEGDIANTALVRKILVDYRPAAVVHFAASAYVGESMENPRKYFQNNVVGSLSLLEAILDTGMPPIVFSSSCTTYGDQVTLPITEAQPQRPVNPYGETKLLVEQALRAYDRAYGLRSVALRYFNAAGADASGDIGEEHNPEPHLIPLVIQAALGIRPEIAIFGTDYPTPDGTALRDYVHVADLARAHTAAIQYLLAGGESVALNLGTGRGYSVREVINAVENVTGRHINVRNAPRRPGDPPALIADASAAHKVLDWTPRESDLQTIVGSAWRWHVGRMGTR